MLQVTLPIQVMLYLCKMTSPTEMLYRQLVPAGQITLAYLQMKHPLLPGAPSRSHLPIMPLQARLTGTWLILLESLEGLSVHRFLQAELSVILAAAIGGLWDIILQALHNRAV